MAWLALGFARAPVRPSAPWASSGKDIGTGIPPHPHFAAKAAADTVTGRFTRPEEVADLVVFLASARVSNLTGADIVIDGGLIQTM